MISSIELYEKCPHKLRIIVRISSEGLIFIFSDKDFVTVLVRFNGVSQNFT